MLCFVPLWGRLRTIIDFSSFWHLFQLFLSFSPFLPFFVTGKKVSLVCVKRTTLKNRWLLFFFFSFCSSSSESSGCKSKGGVPWLNVHLFYWKNDNCRKKALRLDPVFNFFHFFRLLRFFNRYSKSVPGSSKTYNFYKFSFNAIFFRRGSHLVMYTFSWEKVTSVEKMLISSIGALLDDCHFYQGRDNNSYEVVTFPIGKRTLGSEFSFLDKVYH